MNLKRMFLKRPLKDILAAIFIYNFPRKILFNIWTKRLYRMYRERDKEYFPRKMQDDKFFMARNMLRAVDMGVKTGRISRKVWSRFVKSFAELPLKETNKIKEFEEKYGMKPPGFITLSPIKLCNLYCQGCYADSYKGTRAKLEYPVVERIIREQKELWGSHFTVISGGEPLLYRDGGKDLFDLAKEHQDTFFLMYTNGTLIDERVAKKFAEVGNITPAISVEGFEKETDERRGKGVFQKILRAFENLHGVGVPFGISLTATRENADLILKDELIEFYFEEQGALYAWIFQYMPIGRHITLKMMVTPEQRIEMYKRTWELIRERGLFIADFWNCGAITSGCISAGKPGGYIYIDWNGNVMPCVFNPYKIHNILQVYAQGENLNTVLFSPFMEGIRKWQREYALEGPSDKMGNIIVPCAIRDHYSMMYELIKKTDAQPADEAAEQAIKDEKYYEGLVRYGKEVKELADVIWEKEYLEPEREILRMRDTKKYGEEKKGIKKGFNYLIKSLENAISKVL